MLYYVQICTFLCTTLCISKYILPTHAYNSPRLTLLIHTNKVTTTTILTRQQFQLFGYICVLVCVRVCACVCVFVRCSIPKHSVLAFDAVPVASLPMLAVPDERALLPSPSLGRCLRLRSGSVVNCGCGCGCVCLFVCCAVALCSIFQFVPLQQSASRSGRLSPRHIFSALRVPDLNATPPPPPPSPSSSSPAAFHSARQQTRRTHERDCRTKRERSRRGSY